MKTKLTPAQPTKVARSPFRGLMPRPWLDDVFERYFSDMNGDLAEVANASMDVAETDKAFEVKVDLPGVKPDDVDISIDNNTLTVRGERCEESEEKNEAKQYHRVERRVGSFARSVVLPNSVNADETAAEFKDGVLKIVIPKSSDARPRRIKIKT